METTTHVITCRRPLPDGSRLAPGRAARRWVAPLLIALAAAGCGGGGTEEPIAAADVTLSTEEAAFRRATVAWETPTTNVDGSALTDLAGYRIYYGQRSGDYDHTMEVTDPTQTSVRLSNLARGTWYVSARSYRANGLESSLAAEFAFDNTTK